MVRSKAQYSMTFAFYYTVAIVVLSAALFALQEFAPDLAASPMFLGALMGGSIAVLVIPVATVAKSFVTHEKRKTTFGEGWSLSIMFTIIAFVITIVFSVVANIAIYGNASGAADTNDLMADPAGLAIFGGVVFVVILLLYRMFLWAAIKGEMKKIHLG
ncbi:ABZJ_00895 family protein [Parasulfitobacter algicola]|uniref:Uncharacterized protein n=1 Tax=Parasulfitobacter algicola TaxID=2614809 RepID=A0ABX2ISN4_9RHOB|nr:ABZJ_00895 family protein [Sulfitobacter algicola]NSX55917.1 hypothetical protein [Sulfitobacter algicola]